MPKVQRLLLVDDSRVARLTLKHLLNNTGLELEIHEAGNADEALEVFQAQQQAFDKALIDYNMPGRDGIELAGELKQLQPDLSMILVTANIQDAIRERAANLKMQFLGKPVDLEQLTQMIKG
ncbi:response regulator [Marinospirillum perlucidum]|uniref:response regulator n=1 Tax=Marinospirillum perlucidum TaxID=1982602 RepID=UPI000DF429CD|nr:response regulator [Marinospirillum perlucidum]